MFPARCFTPDITTSMKSGYSVLRFALQHSADGKLTQQVKSCGDFSDVEQAFDTARAEALREWQQAVSDSTLKGGHVREIRIKDTEWGYELKRDHLVVTRYWVHDGSPAALA
jgi:hypothetical protein